MLLNLPHCTGQPRPTKKLSGPKRQQCLVAEPQSRAAKTFRGSRTGLLKKSWFYLRSLAKRETNANRPECRSSAPARWGLQTPMKCRNLWTLPAVGVTRRHGVQKQAGWTELWKAYGSESCTDKRRLWTKDRIGLDVITQIPPQEREGQEFG